MTSLVNWLWSGQEAKLTAASVTRNFFFFAILHILTLENQVPWNKYKYHAVKSSSPIEKP